MRKDKQYIGVFREAQLQTIENQPIKYLCYRTFIKLDENQLAKRLAKDSTYMQDGKRLYDAS